MKVFFSLIILFGLLVPTAIPFDATVAKQAAPKKVVKTTAIKKPVKKQVKKYSAKKSSTAAPLLVREMEGIWESHEYYELQDMKWVKEDSSLGYFIIIKGKKICPRSNPAFQSVSATAQCLGGEAGYAPYELVPEGDGFLLKKNIIGSPVGNERVIYRDKRIELITEGMGTAKYILKKITQPKTNAGVPLSSPEMPQPAKNPLSKQR